MRSKILRACDLMQAVQDFPWKARPDEKSADEKMYQIALPHKRYEQAETVAPGDVVSITMRAEHKKFNRTIKLQVGSNMFDRELEAALVGKMPNREYSLEHPVGTVAYCIGDIQRLVIPEVTDEMAVAAEMEGVHTARALRQYYLKQALKEELRNEAFGFVEKFLKQWEFSIDEAELDEMDEEEMERCRQISRSMNLVFDEMTEEQLLGAVGCHNIPEFRTMIHGFHTKVLSAALAEAAIGGADTAAIPVADTRVHYGALLNRVADCAMHLILEETVC